MTAPFGSTTQPWRNDRAVSVRQEQRGLRIDLDALEGEVTFGDGGKIVSAENISLTPQGSPRKLVQGRFRRWWLSRRGWTHYVGQHEFR